VAQVVEQPPLQVQSPEVKLQYGKKYVCVSVYLKSKRNKIRKEMSVVILRLVQLIYTEEPRDSDLLREFSQNEIQDQI
jgi:hypothetical protein